MNINYSDLIGHSYLNVTDNRIYKVLAIDHQYRPKRQILIYAVCESCNIKGYFKPLFFVRNLKKNIVK